MIHYLQFKPAQETFAVTATAPNNWTWLSVEQPTETEIKELISTYQLPEDYITSVLDQHENSRVEGFYQTEFTKPALMLIQYPRTTLSPSGFIQLETHPFAMILTPDKKIITVSNQPADFVKETMTAKFSDTGLPLYESLLLQLSLRVALSYNRFLREVIKQIEKLEGELKVSTENNQLYQMMDIQKSLVYFEAALSANLNVLEVLYKTTIFHHPKAHLSYLHDVLVETKQGLTTTRIQLKLVDKISDTFSAIVSNNLNNVMKILTSLTIVLTIPTIIGGLFGMNVKLPFADRADAFLWIFILTTILCIIVIRRLRKRNLL